MKKPIGLFGGTFDPIHHGHLRSALDIASVLDLEYINIVPNHRSPHKQSNNTSNEHRLAMLKLAVEHCPQLSIDERELHVEGPSYTVNTLETLRTNHPERPICFLMGMDSLLSFTKWHRWQDILSVCHLVVSQRPGWPLPDQGEIAQLLDKHRCIDADILHQTLNGHIFIHHAHPLSISSSEIRDLTSRNQTCQFLLPDAVNAYIVKHRLYQQS
ncbi:nicotinic acid mononucleotide adenylyltransferase [Alteromonadales bacterium alter-6D02]|nr:nicotinic acid mononucleotide adenylyltransferase [Alteromonadales bacterium alter-6D02]